MESGRLARRLGVTHGLIQAPMAGSQDSELALSVASAGALGSLPCAMLAPDALRAELERIAAQGNPPINLNFFCHTEPAPDAARERAFRDALAPYYRELGLDPHATVDAPRRRPFDEQTASLLSDYEPRVLSFHFGLPAPELVSRVKSWGALILSTATTVEEARWLEARGADVIIAQGVEAGGHRGSFLSDGVRAQLATLALVPQVVDAVQVPVVAAGGIADERGIAAALALGAQGVQLGTAFLCCPEATTSALHREALRSDVSTELTNLFSGRPARGISNRLMRELGPCSSLPPPFPLASAALAPLRAAAEARGDGSFSPLWAGQNRSGCSDGPAAELTRRLCRALG